MIGTRPYMHDDQSENDDENDLREMGRRIHQELQQN